MCYSPQQLSAVSDRAKYLHDQKAHVEAVRVEDCGRKTLIYHNPDTDEVKFVPGRCGSKWCPICGPAQQQIIQSRIQHIIDHTNNKYLRMITITQVDYEGESLESAATRFRGALTSLRRSVFWKRKIWGAYVKYEATYNAHAKTWHYHAHILAHSAYVPRDDLLIQWRKRSPGAIMVDIRRITAGTATELSKYVTKLKCRSDIPLDELTWHMSNHRMIATEGTIRAMWTSQGMDDTQSNWVYLGSTGQFVDNLRLGDRCQISILVCKHIRANAPPDAAQWDLITARAIDYLLSVDEYDEVTLS